MFERDEGGKRARARAGGGGGNNLSAFPCFFHQLMFTCVPLVYLFEQLERRVHIAFLSVYMYYNNIRAFIQSNSCLVCNAFRRHWCGLKNSSTIACQIEMPMKKRNRMFYQGILVNL